MHIHYVSCIGYSVTSSTSCIFISTLLSFQSAPAVDVSREIKCKYVHRRRLLAIKGWGRFPPLSFQLLPLPWCLTPPIPPYSPSHPFPPPPICIPFLSPSCLFRFPWPFLFPYSYALDATRGSEGAVCPIIMLPDYVHSDFGALQIIYLLTYLLNASLYISSVNIRLTFF